MRPCDRTYDVKPVAKALIRALDDGDELIAVYGGMRSGKTWAITQACLVLCQTRRELDPVSGSTKPLEILITRSTFGQIKASFMPSFRAIIEPLGARYIQEPGNTRWIMPNGSIIHWRAYRLHSTQGESESSIEGLGFSVVFGDEATQYPDAFFNHTLERTSQPSINIITGKRYMGSQVVWSSRPAADVRFLTIAQEHHRSGISGRVIISQTRDCQTHEYMEKLRKSHPKSIFDAITQDVPWSTVPVTGNILSDWVPEEWPAGNLLTLDLDLSRPTYICIDPGVTTTSVTWIQLHEIKGSTLAVIVDEWHPDTPTSTQDIVAEAHRRGFDLIEAIIDPAADSRTRAAGLTTEARILSRAPDVDPDGLGGGLGVPVRAVIPADRRGVREGLYRVMARVCAADGSRHLVARRELWDAPQSPRGLKFSVQNYRWGPDGEPLKGSKGRHADHCIDTIRYWVCHHAWHGPAVAEAKPVQRGTSTPIPPRRHAVQRRAHRAGSK